MKSNNAIVRELRADLRYWQERARIDASCLAGSRRKCAEIGAKMRALQPKPVRMTTRRPTAFEADATQEGLL